MRFSWRKALTIAEREYLTTIRRKAFLFTLFGTPALWAFLMFIMFKPQISARVEQMRNFRVLGVVDSSGAFWNARPEIVGAVETDLGLSGPAPAGGIQTFRTEVRFLLDQNQGEQALRRGQISEMLVVPANFLETGRLRRYVVRNNLFTSADERTVSGWVVRTLLANRVDSLRIERVTRPARDMQLYTMSPQGAFEHRDSRRELLDFMLPVVLGMLMGLCIVIGGQYLLQGVSEEKESRILESLLCTVSAEELLAGKLLGLGAAGLTIVAAWMILGAALAGPSLAMANVHLRPSLLVVAVIYFLLGYLFYGSLMTGIGAITHNMREAQQFAFFFTFMNFIPFYLSTSIIGRPDSRLAMQLSFFPPMAPVAMMLRLCSPSAAVPNWQIALSIGLLATSAGLVLLASARLFRIGLLLYGKTPTFAEIVRWIGKS